MQITASDRIKEKALELGFQACGITKAQKLNSEEKPLRDYLANGYHGQMGYMAKHTEMRLDPTLLVPGAKSLVVLLLNYFPNKLQKGDCDMPIISKYAYGKDYHYVIKDKLQQLLVFINNEIEPVQGRFFTDSAPVLERAWAVQAGLGWIGKNGLLINKQLGSFVFISELIIDLDLDYDQPYTAEHCGKCNQCLSACPTQAFVKPYILDAQKCISYLTIELKSDVPEEYQGKLSRRVFGCDICQDVCPWNRNPKPTNIDEFKPNDRLLELSNNEWQNMSKQTYKELFKKTPVERAGYEKFRQTIGHSSKTPSIEK